MHFTINLSTDNHLITMQTSFLIQPILIILIIILIIIMETFHFEFQLKLQLQISLLQGNLQLASLGLQRKRLLQAQTKEIKKKEKVCSSLFVLEVVSSRDR